MGFIGISARESLLRSTSSTAGSSNLHNEQFDAPIHNVLL
jgi:hypothetical protein